MATVSTILKIIWAAPWTLFGLTVGCFGLATGGRVQRTGHVLEFSGGWITLVLKIFPVISGATAVTFGHVILARSQADLEACRQHELVHVRQYERWGPLFVPAYLFWRILLRLTGKDPYRDNPFERQACQQTN
jgi:hypothetical protein